MLNSEPTLRGPGLLGCSVAILALAVTASASAQNHEAHIAKIETNLLPKYVIEGVDPTSRSVSERMNAYSVPGLSVAYFEDGAIQWSRAYGHISSLRTKPVDANTRFQAASLSKPMTATVMMALVQSGKLTLDADVNQYLRNWKVPMAKSSSTAVPTLAQLASHSGGINMNGFEFSGYLSGEALPTTEEILRGVRPAKNGPVLPMAPPGKRENYSGGGYVVIQKVMEDVMKTGFPSLMNSRLFQPLAMRDSGFEQPLPKSLRGNAAVGHEGDGTPLDGDWMVYPELAAAGLWSCPSDIARWAISIQKAYNGSEHELLSPAVARRMLSKIDVDSKFGLGVRLNGAGDGMTFGHTGANEGYRCVVVAFARSDGPGVVVMTNGDSGQALCTEYLRTVSMAYGLGIYKPEAKRLLSLSEAQRREFRGIYEANSELRVRVIVGEGTLKAQLPFNDEPAVIYPVETDEFIDSYGENTLRFKRDAGGNVSKLVLRGFDLPRVGAE